MWRASLADGRVVSSLDAPNILSFVDLIVRFDVVGPLGTFTVEPPAGHRVVFVRERVGGPGVDAQTVAYKVGLLNRATGELEMRRVIDGAPAEGSTDIAPEVLALYEAA